MNAMPERDLRSSAINYETHKKELTIKSIPVIQSKVLL